MAEEPECNCASWAGDLNETIGDHWPGCATLEGTGEEVETDRGEPTRRTTTGRLSVDAGDVPCSPGGGDTISYRPQSNSRSEEVKCTFEQCYGSTKGRVFIGVDHAVSTETDPSFSPGRGEEE